MKRLLIIGLTALLALPLRAQFYSSSSDVVVMPGGNIHITGSWDLITSATGDVQNGGYVYVADDVINDGAVSGSMAGASGTYEVLGDWINNGTFNQANSLVWLNGFNQQITGTSVTTYWDLLLSNAGSVKTQTIDANAENTLDLTDVELATDLYIMHVLNTDPDAILRTPGYSGGFVSSLGTGHLARNTNNTVEYIFPTGSSLGTYRYRPVVMTPQSVFPHTFGVRLANVDATSEGFNRDLKTDELCLIIPDWYHRIYRTSGAEESDIAIYHLPADDGEWLNVAQWDGTQWDNEGGANQFTIDGMLASEIYNHSDFSQTPFALAAPVPFLEAGEDQHIFPGETAYIDPIYYGTTPLDIDWSPVDYLDCLNCLDVNANPVATTEYTIIVEDLHGCKVRDSVRIFLNPQTVLIPSGFSPNGDGVNDEFRVLNENIEEMKFQIFNRWGILLFETNEVERGWDGTYLGEPQELGVYVYQIVYRLEGEFSERVSQGNVTLLR